MKAKSLPTFEKRLMKMMIMNKDINNIGRILADIKRLVDIDKQIYKEKRKRGECFNVFQILNLSRSEVRLHSAFLAELLHPNGNHGLKDKFLSAFLECINRKASPFSFDTSSAQVSVEYNIGNVSEDYTEGGRIDLFIQDKNHQTIIIENKIDAGDQPCQMYRYHKYAKSNLCLNDDNLRLIYLTLNGDAPSEGSLNNCKFDYLKLSYREDILTWLDQGVAIAALKPVVRETIVQYINNLKDILSIMEENNNENLLNILTSPENVESTIAVFEHYIDVQNKIRSNFISQIQEACNVLGLSSYCDEGVRTTSVNSWLHIYNPQYSDVEFRIGVKSHTNQDGYRMGFVSKSGRTNNSDYKFWANDNSLEEFPFGWTYLWGEDGENGRWWRWDDWQTLKDMTNGKMLGFIKKILEQIAEEHLFEKMDNMLS